MLKTSSAGVVLDVEPGKRRIDATPEPDSPFQVLIVGDFSGRASRGVSEPILGRRPVAVDRDEIETLPGVLNTELCLSLGRDADNELRFRFKELDDFHPDRIYEDSELFLALRAMRGQLANPTSLKKVTDEILGGLARAPEPEAQPSSSIITGSLLDQIAEESEVPAAARRTTKPKDPLLAYVHDLVAPHLVPGETPKQKELLARVDADISEQMRLVLHDPLFQSLESSWRALDFLVRNVETGPELKIYLLDVSKTELVADLAAVSDLRKSGLYQILSVAPANGEPWAVIGCDCYFRPWIDDIELLARVALLADLADAPVLAGADCSVLGIKAPEQLGEPDEWAVENPVWDEIRTFPEASRVGLALPRFLLRLPYGRNTSPVERFTFEEMPEGSTHAHYLWGNPMYLCVNLIAQAFTESKWNLRPGQIQNISGLPLHTWTENGSVELKPCAEVHLTLSGAETMIEHGLIPLLTMKGTDMVRVGMFHSIAKPSMPLRGRWS